MTREKFGSRLGFILVSAGCAVGLGNVWKFPYMCGQYGGAIFILIYLLFLVILGLPVMVCEFSVGRGSQKSMAASYKALEPRGTKWHQLSLIGVIGCYLLMMFYTAVGGWMLYYCYKNAAGHFVGATSEAINDAYAGMLGDPANMMFWTVLTIVISFAVCFIGMKNGVERITKVMMLCLLCLMGVLAVRVVTLPGAIEGIKFYLVPNLSAITKDNIGEIIFGAMNQAFFTLSLGIGSMAIFGSYLDRDRSIPGEAVCICSLDTLVALLAGFIVIPSCFAFNVDHATAGPGLIFKTLPNVFANMGGGRLWGTLFFLFLAFAALTTIIAVFESIVAFAMDVLGWSRQKSVIVNLIALCVLSVPAVLGFSVWAGFQPVGPGSNFFDLEDFIVSSNLLPLGSVIYILFCTTINGWGWKNFLAEANTGKGMKFSGKLRFYMTYILPVIIIAIYVKGYYDKFYANGITTASVIWTVLALALVAWIAFCVLYRNKKAK